MTNVSVLNESTLLCGQRLARKYRSRTSHSPVRYKTRWEVLRIRHWAPGDPLPDRYSEARLPSGEKFVYAIEEQLGLDLTKPKAVDMIKSTG